MIIWIESEPDVATSQPFTIHLPVQSPVFVTKANRTEHRLDFVVELKQWCRKRYCSSLRSMLTEPCSMYECVLGAVSKMYYESVNVLIHDVLHLVASDWHYYPLLQPSIHK